MGGKSNHFKIKYRALCKVFHVSAVYTLGRFFSFPVYCRILVHLMFKSIFILSLLTAFGSQLHAQNIAQGQWKAHLSQNDPIDLFVAEPYVYAWTKNGFSRYNLLNKETQALSKIEKFTEVGLSYAAHYDSLKTTVIAYQNSNIDLMLPDGSIYNVPDLLNASVNGSKEISQISFYSRYAFFSAGFGILVYDLDKKESSADYKSDLIRNVRSTEVFQGFVYAATDHGVFRAPLPAAGININANEWALVDSGNYHSMVKNGGELFFWHDSLVRAYDGLQFEEVLSNKNFRNLKSHLAEVYMTTDSGVWLLHESPLGFVPMEGSKASLRHNGDWFYASFGYGMIQKFPNGNIEFLSPSGPYASGSGKMASYGNSIYIGGGTLQSNGGVTYSYNGFYTYTEGYWTSSVSAGIPYIDTMYDIHAVCIDPSNGDLWVAALEQGLARIRGNKVLEFYDETNSPLKLGITRNITGLVMDANRNLWVANFDATSPLLVKSPSGVWDSFPNINSAAVKVLDLLIDRSGQKWLRFTGGTTGNPGILVFNDKNTPFDKSDDPLPSGIILSSATGSGNLPDNKVNCMALDRNGQVWVGTDKGLTVFYTPSNITGTNPSDARQIVVGKGDNAGYLLGEETIYAIYVDGGNRKWIASRSGLWLVSPDGQEILAHYNEANSPLFSNEIKELGMVETTGELFIATSKGLMSLGTGSSVGGDTHGEVKVYPNPVRPDFEGDITVSGLPVDAFVKITDISGNLIYETRANGGTATWNGKSFDGRKASSGVYLIFTGNQDGSDTFVSKLLIVN